MPIAVSNSVISLENKKGKIEHLKYNNIMNLNGVTMHKTDNILSTRFNP